ncbi:hypothetical protein PG990_001452 [Apiospora arundinis]|uniref:Uncharacterized protein n=1 Tax=Apiospora arundinis TaxID=335852 RepID=A0ABR2I245_9PEZI
MPLRHTGSIALSRLASSPPSLTSRSPPLLDEDASTDDDEFDMPLLQRNPLTYFLTPATPREEDLEFDFDFDAGIEDSSRPQEVVRSISPSTLDGLKRYKPRNKDECAILDDNADSDDDEDYIRFRPSKSASFSLPDFGFDRLRPTASRSQSNTTKEELLSATSFHVGSPRGRPTKRFSPPPRRAFPGRTRSFDLPRRHSWREPSPDVWAIDEEPEKETMSELGLSVEDLAESHKTQPINIPAAKPVKKVRFILPVKE